MRIFYLSFADEQGFIGALIIAGSDFLHAIGNARTLGLHPGGEVAGKDITDFPEQPAEFVGRLLSREDLENWDRQYKQRTH